MTAPRIVTQRKGVIAVRGAICRGCTWFGLELDEAANREHRERISALGGRIVAFVIKTDENLMIARHARALVERRKISVGG